MAKFNSEHKESIQRMMQTFDKVVQGNKLNSYEIADFVNRAAQLLELEDCPCSATKQIVPKEPEKVSENGKK